MFAGRRCPGFAFVLLRKQSIMTYIADGRFYRDDFGDQLWLWSKTVGL